MPKAAIEFYFDPISPYGYLASTQIEALAARYGREIDWKPVLLGITVMKVMGLPPLIKTGTDHVLPLRGSWKTWSVPD